MNIGADLAGPSSYAFTFAQYGAVTSATLPNTTALPVVVTGNAVVLDVAATFVAAPGATTTAGGIHFRLV